MTKRYTTIIITIFIVFFNIIVFKFPKEIIEASSKGLIVWYKNLIPSLLPFIFLNNISRETGVFYFLGNLICSPLSKLLKISNISTISYISALFSGYPIGSKLVSDNFESNMISKDEARNVALFSNIASPLFIIGTVGSSLFHQKELGFYILFIQIISSLLLGIFLSLFHDDFYTKKIKTPNFPSFYEALNYSINNSIHTITIIGCYVVILSILTEIFLITGVMNSISNIFSLFLSPLGFSENHNISLIIGFFEMTSGLVYLSNNEHINLQSLVVINTVLAFGGLSINTQCISFLSNIKLSTFKFILFRFIQATISAIITVISFKIYFQF